MKIALVGYGKMGKLVEALALREGWEVGPKLDLANNPSGKGISPSAMRGVDVAVDFSQPGAVIANIEACARSHVNVVVGTTGWFHDLARAQELVSESSIGLVYSPNFSLGMNLFFEIARRTAQVMGHVPGYDSYVVEQHHREKKDVPSGTAIRLIEITQPYLRDGSSAEISSIRAGFMPGTHLLGFDSEADTIILEHRARNRQGFAEGAILAARWIWGRQGFYPFEQILREIFHLNGEREDVSA
jgi:4-hydroxy-tetrahydrodipicolinate reductase